MDGRSDIFALGAVLYESLVGEPPPPRTPSGMLRAGDDGTDSASVRLDASHTHVRGADSGIQRAAKLIPPAWRGVIERAMASSPADRFADAREVAHALRAARVEIAAVEAK